MEGKARIAIHELRGPRRGSRGCMHACMHLRQLLLLLLRTVLLLLLLLLLLLKGRRKTATTGHARMALEGHKRGAGRIGGPTWPIIDVTSAQSRPPLLPPYRLGLAAKQTVSSATGAGQGRWLWARAVDGRVTKAASLLPASPRQGCAGLAMLCWTGL